MDWGQGLGKQTCKDSYIIVEASIVWFYLKLSFMRALVTTKISHIHYYELFFQDLGVWQIMLLEYFKDPNQRVGATM